MKDFYMKRIKRITRDVKKKNVKENSKKNGKRKDNSKNSKKRKILMILPL